MATSKFVLKTLPDIDRPAIIYAMPAYDAKQKAIKSVYMLDLGANITCTSEQLYQFAVMGSILASQNIENPKVALLNIGSEEMKGLDNIKEAANMLSSQDKVNYVGYVEGHQILSGDVDVIVCDGFTGNIALKAIEGTAKIISNIIKDTFRSTILSKIAMLIAVPFLKKISKKLDLNQHNGAPLLGLRGIVIKSHGGATIKAFEMAIEEAIREIRYDIPAKIQEHIEQHENS